jgi:hypothetical protein
MTNLIYFGFLQLIFDDGGSESQSGSLRESCSEDVV